MRRQGPTGPMRTTRTLHALDQPDLNGWWLMFLSLLGFQGLLFFSGRFDFEGGSTPTTQSWFKSWIPDFVFCACQWVSSVDACLTASLDIKTILGDSRNDDLHLFVADVLESFDTSRLVLFGWFRRVYFAYHAQVRLRFQLATYLSWCSLDSVWWYSHGCPFSTVLTVALNLLWCRHVEGLHGVTPQLYADDLECTSRCADGLLAAARVITAYHVWLGRFLLVTAC